LATCRFTNKIHLSSSSSSSFDDAGAIAMQNSGSSVSRPLGVIRLERGVVFARKNARDKGGALYVVGRSDVQVYGNVDFVDNSADEGGAIDMEGNGDGSLFQGTPDIRDDVSFRENTALDFGWGGALYLKILFCARLADDVGFRRTRAGIFDENRAHEGGGAFFIACSTFSGACLKAFEPSNNFGCLPSVPTHRFKGNVEAYGNDFASNPAHLRLLDVGEDLTLVPGQQKMLAGAEFLHSLHRRCRQVEEVLMVSVCRYSRGGMGRGETQWRRISAALWSTGQFRTSTPPYMPR
jgi:hypothetical protein